MAKKVDTRQATLDLNTDAADLLRRRSIRNALQTLRVLNCKYAVQMPDGTEEINGNVRAKFSSGMRKLFTKVNNFRETGYLEKIKAMVPGKVECFEYDPAWNFPVDKWRFAISGGLCKQFGPQMCKTTVVREGNKITIMALSNGYAEGYPKGKGHDNA